MPILEGTPLVAIPDMLAANVASYNEKDIRNMTGYNRVYRNYITSRSRGIEAACSLSAWLEGDGIASIQAFLLAYLFIPRWTAELQKQIEYAQKEFGYFTNPESMRIHEDEYPGEEMS